MGAHPADPAGKGFDPRLLDAEYRASLPANHPRRLMVENAPPSVRGFPPECYLADGEDVAEASSMMSGYSDENKERYFQWFIGAVGSWELEKTGDTAEALDKAYITYVEFWSVLMAFGFMGFTRVRLRAGAPTAAPAPPSLPFLRRR